MYGMEPRLPSFPAPDMPKYSESEATDRLRELQITRHIAMEHNLTMTDDNLVKQNKSTTTFQFQEGQLVYYNQTNFLHKNRKLAQNWIGPVVIKKVRFPNLELKLQNGRSLVIHVDRVKPFNFPKSHKIENEVEKMVPETQSDLIKKNGEKKEIDKSKDNIKIKNKIKIDTPHHMTTRSKAKINFENVNLISHLFTAENKYKLEDIIIKHHSQIELTKSETSFWNSFDAETKYFLLTGDPWNKVTLDRTKFINFEDCPAPAPVIAPPLPIPPVNPPPVRQIPSLPLTRPLPFGPPTEPSIITSAKRQQERKQEFNSDSSDSDDQEQFQSPDTSPEVKTSRKDTKRDEFLANTLLATEKQNLTRQQKKKKIKTPPATPNHWPPAKPDSEEDEDIDNNKGTCSQQ
jgi:hypothetical protein